MVRGFAFLTKRACPSSYLFLESVGNGEVRGCVPLPSFTACHHSQCEDPEMTPWEASVPSSTVISGSPGGAGVGIAVGIAVVNTPCLEIVQNQDRKCWLWGLLGPCEELLPATGSGLTAVEKIDGSLSTSELCQPPRCPVSLLGLPSGFRGSGAAVDILNMDGGSPFFKLFPKISLKCWFLTAPFYSPQALLRFLKRDELFLAVKTQAVNYF